MPGNWRHSITLRLSVAFALLATLVFAALGLYFSRAADAHMAELDAHDLMGKQALLQHVSQSETSPAGFAERLGDALVGEHGLLVAVDGKNGPIFHWPDNERTAALAAVALPEDQAPQRLAVMGVEYRAVAGRFHSAWSDGGRVVVARDIRHHTDFLEQLQRDFQVAVLLAAVLTALVGVWIARLGMRPVRDMAQAAGRISAGQLAERMPEGDVPPELAELVHSFNAMLGRLEESFTRLSDFSADLAHELRTPIHSLRMQAEVSLGKARSADEYRELLESNLEEYERLSRMIADMLFLAKANHGLLMPNQEAVELMDLCRGLIEYYGLLADEIALDLSGEAVAVNGDRLMLQRAIGNLLLNAIQHTPQGGQVRLRVSRAVDRLRLSIANTGAPIPAELLGRIFERFVRPAGDREGNGLGLAIARSIILAHGGTISVRSDEQLTEFVIELSAR